MNISQECVYKFRFFNAYMLIEFFQFVELKGSVFKKFDKNNLFQVSCSDVRERFHLFVLLFIVVLQTMKEYSWKEGMYICDLRFLQCYYFMLTFSMWPFKCHICAAARALLNLNAQCRTLFSLLDMKTTFTWTALSLSSVKEG